MRLSAQQLKQKGKDSTHSGKSTTEWLKMKMINMLQFQVKVQTSSCCETLRDLCINKYPQITMSWSNILKAGGKNPPQWCGRLINWWLIVMENYYFKLLLINLALQATERLEAFSFSQSCRTCSVKTCHMTVYLSLKLRLKPGEGSFLKN